MKPIRALAAMVALGLLSAACSSTERAAEAGAEIPPPNTLYELSWSETWDTSNNRPELGAEAFPSLVPVSGPSGQGAEITFNATNSGGQPAVDLVVRWGAQESDIASLNITRRASVDNIDCGAIEDGESYEPVSILDGSVAACASTSEEGFFFLRWNSAGDSYLLQSTLDQQQSIAYLSTWESL